MQNGCREWRNIVELYSHDSQKRCLFETKIPKTHGYFIFFGFSCRSQIWTSFWDGGNVSGSIQIFLIFFKILLINFLFITKLSQISSRITQPLIRWKQKHRTKESDDFVVNRPMQSKKLSKWKLASILRSLDEFKNWFHIQT